MNGRTRTIEDTIAEKDEDWVKARSGHVAWAYEQMDDEVDPIDAEIKAESARRDDR